MELVAAVDWRHYMFMIPLTLLSIFLILVILVQRGRGGGLTGALGGMGGQSAFGTKAGDLFTRITIVVAAIWVLLSMASIKVLTTYTATANFDPSQRGQATPMDATTVDATTVDKGAGGLLPGATNSAEAPESPTGKAAEAPDGTTTAPATTSDPAGTSSSPAPADGKTDAGAKPADAAKP